MNEQNLNPPFTPSQAREYGRKGGQRAAQVKREKKAVQDLLNMVLDMPVTSEVVLKDIKKNGYPLPQDPTYKAYIISAVVIRTAKRGTMADLEKLAQLLGETPTQNDVTLDKAIELLSSVESVID